MSNLEGSTATVAAVADRIGAQLRIRHAILQILREAPRADFELIPAYCNLREQNQWPWVANLHEITAQRKALTDEGRIHDTGIRRHLRDGRDEVVWAETATCDVPDCRLCEAEHRSVNDLADLYEEYYDDEFRSDVESGLTEHEAMSLAIDRAEEDARERALAVWAVPAPVTEVATADAVSVSSVSLWRRLCGRLIADDPHPEYSRLDRVDGLGVAR